MLKIFRLIFHGLLFLIQLHKSEVLKSYFDNKHLKLFCHLIFLPILNYKALTI